ncbi:hypothetical protein LUZ61_002076 [Rhynchospora tenuis]|uniref:Peptidyl-prolyl cis-trans isomerase n=1 Tax=Rhynchospora tenuis TaxID=198213 RepID=A0AAD5ZI69_9POAL|nr:hypothetical protein LUZ61_002076 [Rhynchospora tenuis]
MATAAPPPPSLPPPPRRHQFRRRSFLLLPFTSSLLHPLSSSSAPLPSSSPPITDRVYMDFSLCPSYLRPDRPLGASSDLSLCPDAEPLGRVVFGLYGRSVPITVSNFRAICANAAYRGSLVHKLLPGQFFVAGKQGLRRDKGEVRPPPGLVRNVETVNPKAFELKHVRPGTLSLCLGQNDDEDEIKLDPEYHNMEFLVTTGPGPCPQLDNENIVFGTVLEGMDVVTAIASFPTYRPAERIRQFNDFAVFIGDERAQVARSTWDRPLKTVYISDCGELKVTKPELTPSLP